MRAQKEEIKNIEESKRKYKSQAEGMKAHVRMLNDEKHKYDDALKEAQELRMKLEKMKSVELALKGQEGDLNQFLHERGAFDKKTKDVAVLVVALKTKLAEVKKQRNELERRSREVDSRHEMERRKVKSLETQIAELESNNKILEKDLWRCQEDLRSVTERLEAGDNHNNITSDDTLPILSPLKPMPRSPSPSSPALKSGYKLPSYKLVGSVKRALSPDQEDERSPLMPILNHTSKRLATDPSQKR